MGRDREILEIVARYCGKTSSIYRYIAQDIAALTREAAPQANPHAQELMPQELSGEAERIAANLHKTGHGLAATVMRELIRRLATTDSAIQSQQGATGGADGMYVLLDLLRTGRKGEKYPCVESRAGTMVNVSETLDALAHPQAAGSAPGEALHPAHTVEAAKRAFNIDSAGSVASGAGDLSMSMFASRADYEAAAGSAPVGVEADRARLDYMERESMTVQAVAWPTGGGDADVGWEAVTYHMDYPKLRVQGRGTTPREAIDAALEKERAE